ncbi:MAG: tetratricopeptide repeat protein [Bacteroidia bacterium]|nr:tetratricopeptide repeat protein [Bacteroidia bacterium]
MNSGKHDTLNVSANNTLFLEYEFTDSVKAKKYLTTALEIARKIDYKKGLADAYLYLGFYYSDFGIYQQSLTAYENSFKINESIHNEKGIAQDFMNIGIIYNRQGKYLQAINYFQQSLKITEKLSMSSDQLIARSGKSLTAKCLTNIGNVHFYQGSIMQAVDYYKKSLIALNELGDNQSIAKCLMNIGGIYYYQNQTDTAIEYFQKSLQISQQYRDKEGVSKCLKSLGSAYDRKKNYAKALEYFQKALKISQELGDKNEIASTYSSIAALKMNLKQYSEVVENAEKGISISKEFGALLYQRDCYKILAEVSEQMKDFKNAYLNHKLFKLMNDSIFNEQSSKQIKEMEAKYQSEKKQKEIELKESQLAKKDIEVKQQRTQKLAFIGGFILMLILSVVIFKSYRDKKKANILLEKQKHEIEEKNDELNQQNAEIAAQRDEIEAQRDLVTKQKNEIELIHSELTDSIYYAERIQKAVLPGEEYISSLLNNEYRLTNAELRSETSNSSPECSRRVKLQTSNFFILFKPKDIVSGDFYWLAKRNNWLLIAVADCTGHGVPGAFMSMLGISFLNEIIAREDIQTASHVLDELRQYVIKSLQQKGVSGEQKDGMDIAFCALNVKTLEMQYAGANNPLYIIETGESPVSTVREIRPDKMPVAIHENMPPFTNHVIQLQTGDTIYLMSDGYADQFGGPKGKKFYEKQLKEMLTVNSHLSMEEQEKILNNTIEDWMSNYGEKYEQTDDITILGIII